MGNPLHAPPAPMAEALAHDAPLRLRNARPRAFAPRLRIA
jgi:hypothetical protein